MDKKPSEVKRDMRNECYHCKHRRELAWNAHIRCNNPDFNMKGNPHGIKEGWFMYPLLFDPVWKEKLCSNYEHDEAVSRAISQSVSPEK